MARASRIGYILTLIGGIITLFVTLVPLILFVFLISGGAVYSEFLGNFIFPLRVMQIGSGFFFVLMLVIGILKVYAAKMMLVARSTLSGGIMALILGILTGEIFSIIGGIIGIVEGAR